MNSQEPENSHKQLLYNLFTKYYPRLLGFICKIVPAQEGEDICQEAFLRLYQNLPTMENYDKLDSWLRRTAFNIIIDERRKRKLNHAFLQERLREPQKPGSAREHDESVKLCMESLREEFRLVIYLKLFEEKEYDEIAELLHCPIGTIKSRIARAKRDLKQCLEKYHHE